MGSALPAGLQPHGSLILCKGHTAGDLITTEAGVTGQSPPCLITHGRSGQAFGAVGGTGVADRGCGHDVRVSCEQENPTIRKGAGCCPRRDSVAKPDQKLASVNTAKGIGVAVVGAEVIPEAVGIGQAASLNPGDLTVVISHRKQDGSEGGSGESHGLVGCEQENPTIRKGGGEPPVWLRLRWAGWLR